MKELIGQYLPSITEPSAQVKFYVILVLAVILLGLTIAWVSVLIPEVTRKRASKLSVKYGNVDDKSKNAKKLVVSGIVLAVFWILFLIVL